MKKIIFLILFIFCVQVSFAEWFQIPENLKTYFEAFEINDVLYNPNTCTLKFIVKESEVFETSYILEAIKFALEDQHKTLREFGIKTIIFDYQNKAELVMDEEFLTFYFDLKDSNKARVIQQLLE